MIPILTIEAPDHKMLITLNPENSQISCAVDDFQLDHDICTFLLNPVVTRRESIYSVKMQPLPQSLIIKQKSDGAWSVYTDIRGYTSKITTVKLLLVSTGPLKLSYELCGAYKATKDSVVQEICEKIDCPVEFCTRISTFL
jgi:hypothetical protein